MPMSRNQSEVSSIEKSSEIIFKIITSRKFSFDFVKILKFNNTGELVRSLIMTRINCVFGLYVFSYIFLFRKKWKENFLGENTWKHSWVSRDFFLLLIFIAITIGTRQNNNFLRIFERLCILIYFICFVVF